MPALWSASLRHLLRHPAQLLLALLGLSVGVATIIAVDIATASAGRAFQLSMQAVNGTATHQIVGGPSGVDERLYGRLRAHFNTERAADALQAGRSSDGRSGQSPTLDASEVRFAPIVEGYVTAGELTLQLVGIDPFATPELDAAAVEQTRVPAGADLTQWLTGGGAVVTNATTAAALGATTGTRFELEAGGRQQSAVLIAVLPVDQAADQMLFTDIAQAQEWLGQVGHLTRIAVRVSAGNGGERAVARLRAELPPGVHLESAQSRTQQSLDMTAAFTTNLRAMSLLALLVSTLLIYGAVSFAVVQRRRIMGVLRALGATRTQVLRMVLSEAALLGCVGSLLGLLLGSFLGRTLVRLVSQTINDLYFVVAVNQTVLPPTTIVKALLAGVGAALAGALVPALEVAGSMPQLALRRSMLEARAVAVAGRLLIVSALLAGGSLTIVWLSSRSLFAGFVSLFLLLLSVAALTPAMLRALSVAGARAVRGASPVARVALGDIAASLSRTGVAVAALGMALAAMIGVSIMVESFRESLRDWLGHTLRADIYVTAPGTGSGRPERRIDPELLAAMLATPGVTDYGMSRRVMLELPGGPVPLDAVQLARGGYANFTLTAGDARTWREFELGALLVSEPLAWRLRLSVGEKLELPTDSGPQRMRIAGIYQEYANDRGTILMSLPEYRRIWHDPSVTALGVYVRKDVPLPTVQAHFRALARGKQSLYIRSNADLRALSMSIFERTFIITRVLYWLAAGVAAVGLVSALLAWELERSHELAILRSLGLTPGATALLIESQTGFMALTALLAALPAGLLTAWLLIDVINRRAFGWRIDVHLSTAQFTNALMLSLCAALAAGLYPAWRSAHAPIASDIREE